MKQYIDAVNGVAGNAGDIDHPLKLFAQARMLPGDEIYFHAGQSHPIGTYRFMTNDMVLDAYGDGDVPIVVKVVNGVWMYIRDASRCRVRNIHFDGARLDGQVMSVTTSAPGKIVDDFEIKNCRFSRSGNVHGLVIGGYSGGRVRNGQIWDCVFDDNFFHGTLCSTDVQDVIYRRCRATGNGGGSGSHGFTCWAPNAFPAPVPTRITYADCIAERTIDANGQEGNGFQGDDRSRLITMLRCISRHNLGKGFVFNMSDDGRVEDCVAYGNAKANFSTVGDAKRSTWVNNIGVTHDDVISDDVEVRGASTATIVSARALTRSKP